MRWSDLLSSAAGLLSQLSCYLDPEVVQQQSRKYEAQAPLPPTPTTQNAATPLQLKIVATNVDERVIKEGVRAAMDAGQVRDVLRGTRRHRVLQIDNLHSWSGADKRDQNGFRAAVADYTNGRTVYIDSADAFGTSSTLSVTETNEQPPPSREEIAEAAAIAGYGADAIAYATMPPLVTNKFSNGTSHRVVHIMVRAANSTSNQMFEYYVNMNNMTAERAPQSPSARTDLPGWCKVLKMNENLANTTIKKGLPGAANVVISKGGKTLWELTVVRPSASGGHLGSGVDIRNVKYMNKKVLGQGHLPILNVKYLDTNNGQCGSTYRDWQSEEFDFECEGTNVANTNYLRICNKPPKTIVDMDKIDPTQEEKQGFRGVAFYATEDAVLIRSYLAAGWYRYTADWTLCANGTIKPRWGFGAVQDVARDCVCHLHHHHAYFRFDFDIETNYGNAVHEYNEPRKPDQSSNWHEILHAAYSPRNPGPNEAWKKQKWRIINQRTKNSYLMIPGERDKNTEPGDKYGHDGAWIVKHDKNLIDDGGLEVTDPALTVADMTKIMKGSGGDLDSTISGKDVVLWYAVHFMHDEKGEFEHPHKHKHLYGPDLVPEVWK